MATKRRFLKVDVVGDGHGTANPTELAHYLKNHKVVKMSTDAEGSVIVFQMNKWDGAHARRVMSVTGPVKHLLELRDLVKHK